MVNHQEPAGVMYQHTQLAAFRWPQSLPENSEHILCGMKKVLLLQLLVILLLPSTA